MAKHFIIINPFDSLVKVSDKVSELTKRKMLSSPEYCETALSSFSLTTGAEEIIRFLARSNSFQAVLVSAYPAEITRLVANHFGLKYLKIYEKTSFYSSSYVSAMEEFGKPEDDTAVITGHYGEVDEALETGLTPIFFSESKRSYKSGCINAKNMTDVLEGLGLHLHK